MRVRIKYSLPINILLLLAASAVSVGAVRMTRATIALHAEVQEAEARLAAIAAQRHELIRRMAEQDAPEAVEYQAKAQLNLKNPGEEVVVVVPEKIDAPVSSKNGIRERIKIFLRGLPLYLFSGP